MRHLNTRSLRLLGASILVAGIGTFATSVSVFALSGSGPTGSVVSGCSGTASGGSCTVTFNFTVAGGAPACGTTVDFTVSGISTATVTPTSAPVDCTTGDVQALFTPGTGCGTATLTATDTTTTASAQTTDTVACAGTPPLPGTSMLPPGPSPIWGGLAGLAALIVAGGGVTLRRMRSVV